MQESKLRELSMEFSVEIIEAEAERASVPTSMKHSTHKARKTLFQNLKLP